MRGALKGMGGGGAMSPNNTMMGKASKGMQPLPYANPAQMMPMQSQDTPDITYNPNPNVDIPYSARTPELAQMGNRYTTNPTGQEFLNVDPAQFGYPADNTAQQPQGNARVGAFNQRQGMMPPANPLADILKRLRR